MRKRIFWIENCTSGHSTGPKSDQKTSLETHFGIKIQSNASPQHLLDASPRPKLVSGRLSPLFRSSGAASKTYVFLKETIDFPFSEGRRNERPGGNYWEPQCALSPRPPIPSKDRTFPIPYPPVSPTRRPALRGRRIREGCAHFRRPQGSIAVCTGPGVRRKHVFILGSGTGNSIPRESTVHS